MRQLIIFAVIFLFSSTCLMASDIINCPDCSKGVWKGKPCPRCHGTGSIMAPASSGGASAKIPTTITVEPTYYWDVEVTVGRKYSWTEDTYESYKTITTQVQAKSRSEAESIAAGQSYTTRSNLIQATISVEPAGTKNAKFRVKGCKATRQ